MCLFVTVFYLSVLSLCLFHPGGLLLLGDIEKITLVYVYLEKSMGNIYQHAHSGCFEAERLQVILFYFSLFIYTFQCSSGGLCIT